ncbi:45796_t:CDS:2 [Gigaspora margarita]|uniref:45796_t:CDS:1 n=1 Tax=Gigaspora margarita TaxID=4874 RepID=A0ABN7V4M0_GIGMA|nr:45796_t:CDS:2 [Gigaspora margarita]
MDVSMDLNGQFISLKYEIKNLNALINVPRYSVTRKNDVIEPEVVDQ